MSILGIWETSPRPDFHILYRKSYSSHYKFPCTFFSVSWLGFNYNCLQSRSLDRPWERTALMCEAAKKLLKISQKNCSLTIRASVAHNSTLASAPKKVFKTCAGKKLRSTLKSAPHKWKGGWGEGNWASNPINLFGRNPAQKAHFLGSKLAENLVARL